MITTAEKHSIYSPTCDPLPYSSEYLYRCEWVWSSGSQKTAGEGKNIYKTGRGLVLASPTPIFHLLYFWGALLLPVRHAMEKYDSKSLPVGKMLDSVMM